MTNDLVKRLREASYLDLYGVHRDVEREAADRIEELQDIIAKIHHTNLRRDMNAETRTIVIDRLCKGGNNERRAERKDRAPVE
jgi:hypothetical protein